MKKLTTSKVNTKQSTLVEVNLPSCIKIELVQGNELRHYEIFFSLASLSSTIAMGFWTSYLTINPKLESLFWSALAFTLLAGVSGYVAFFYRSKMYNGSTKKVANLDGFEDVVN